MTEETKAKAPRKKASPKSATKPAARASKAGKAVKPSKAAKPAKEKKAGATVTVEQIRSPARRPADQQATLIGLGLNKIRRRSTLEDTPSVRGMIAKVAHLVRVVDESK